MGMKSLLEKPPFESPLLTICRRIPMPAIAAFLLGTTAFSFSKFAHSLESPKTSEVHGFQGSGPLLGQAEAIPAPPMKVRWTYKTDEVERAGIEGAPVIAGQTAYVADAKGTLHALDLKSGTPRWKYKSEDGFATTPLLLDDTIFIGDLAGIFHAISTKTGEKLWTRDVESSIHSSANLP
jgi:outer membrane protein assembly factor BamB